VFFLARGVLGVAAFFGVAAGFLGVVVGASAAESVLTFFFFQL
jgi:hypothetical protein